MSTALIIAGLALLIVSIGLLVHAGFVGHRAKGFPPAIRADEHLRAATIGIFAVMAALVAVGLFAVGSMLGQ